MAKQKLDLEQLEVRIVDKIFFGNDGYAVYEAELLNNKSDDDDFIGRDDIITIQGNFDHRFFSGEEYFMYGTVHEHKKYGKQYKIQLVENKFDTPQRIRAFLLTMVAPAIAEQLINKYSGAVLDKIVNNEVDYSDIKGMGDFRFNALREKVMENKYMKDMIMSLSEYGITPNQMKQIIVTFGANATTKIQENPYVLCKVHGIGFLKADSIADKMGYDMSSTNRIDEAVKYVIAEDHKSGNAWMSKRNLIAECNKLLGIDKKLIVGRFSNVPDIKIVGDKVTLQKTYDAEEYISQRLLEMQSSPVELNFDVEDFICRMEEKYKEEFPNGLTYEQKQLFHNVKVNRVNYLVGYAGCGKSALQKLLLELIKELFHTAILLAPTGKAAKVLEEYTGRKAYTMHRALKIVELEDGEFGAELWEDWIIVDESSMADVFILQRALEALKQPHARILFIGDDFQIPSVGVGNFLHDSIKSGIFPITKLTKVFRQAEGGLLDAVTKIRMGQRFIDDDFIGEKKMGKDLIIRSVEQQYMENGYKYYYEMALRKFSVEDIVVLTPTKKGSLGTVAINNEIQEIVNPASRGKNEVRHGLYTTFREGDRIINLKNTYRMPNIKGEPVDIVNGDMGVIVSIDNTLQQMIIDYDFAVLKVPFKNLDNLTHSYALTIHKSQGSGFKCVIVIMDKSHKWQLNANLAYTAWTRSKGFCFVLCQADVINASMKKNVSLQRNTFLPELLDELAS